jgi:hypothetical protein
MKRIFSLLSVVSAIALALSLQGCEADVDMNNLDTSIEVDAKIATPVGSMHATLGDFVGNGQWGIFVENGVLTPEFKSVKAGAESQKITVLKNSAVLLYAPGNSSNYYGGNNNLDDITRPRRSDDYCAFC